MQQRVHLINNQNSHVSSVKLETIDTREEDFLSYRSPLSETMYGFDYSNEWHSIGKHSNSILFIDNP